MATDNKKFLDLDGLNYYDSKVKARISAEQNARISADANLQSQVSGLAGGSPLVASSVSGMTDTTRVYVNTSDGKWYYYDGDSWEIGGVYQSTALAEGSVDVINLTDNLKTVYDIKTLNSSSQFEWEQGIISANGMPGTDTSHVNWYITIRTPNYLDFTGDFIEVHKKKDYAVMFFLYAENNSFLGRIMVDDYDVREQLVNVRSSYPAAAKIKVAIRQRTTIADTYAPSDYSSAQAYIDILCSPLGAHDLEKYISSTSDTLTTLPSLAFGTDSYASGQTLVKDKLVSFGISNDEHTDYKELHVFSINETTKSYTLLKTLTHNFGHINSVDYCEETDCLIFGNGSGAYGRTASFWIYKNFSQKIEDATVTQLNITDSDCLEFDCSSAPFYNEDKCNVIWFDSNRDNYDLALVVTNDLQKLRVIQLGKGSNEFTYGILQSVGSAEFNGTFNIIETYDLDTSDTEGCVLQDMDFESGKIYCGVGHGYPYYWILTFDRLNNSVNREIVPIYTYETDGTNLSKVVGAICCNKDYVILNTGLIIVKPRI